MRTFHIGQNYLSKQYYLHNYFMSLKSVGLQYLIWIHLPIIIVWSLKCQKTVKNGHCDFLEKLMSANVSFCLANKPNDIHLIKYSQENLHIYS